MKTFQFIIALFVVSFLEAQNEVPRINQPFISLNGDQSLTIQYDLFDLENDACTVQLFVSDNDGLTFNIDVSDVTGDINKMIEPGKNKRIVWDYSNVISDEGDFVVKLVVDDGHSVDIQEVVNEVDIDRLKKELELIAGDRHRRTGPKHLIEVRDLIKEKFKSNFLNFETLEFDYRNDKGINYIGQRIGTTDREEIYIVDAHYDGVRNTPGADDNGSGVTGLLEVSRILSKFQFKKTIKFIAFDMEEDGLVGSRDYVNRKDQNINNIKGVLNFEAMGVYSDKPNSQTLPTGFNILYPDLYAQMQKDSFKGDFIGNIGVANQNDWEQKFVKAANKYVPDLKVVTIVAPENWATLTPDLARSDHAAFWIAKKPAVMLSSTANFRNPNYHTPNDTIGSINYKFVAQVVKATIATLAEEAEILHASFVSIPLFITLDGVNTVGACNATVYPNPVQDNVSISFEECTKFPLDLKIFNIEAKLVHNEKIHKNTVHNINVQSWPKGVYVMKYGGREVRFVK